MRDIIMSMGWASKAWFCAINFTILPLLIIFLYVWKEIRPEVSLFWLLPCQSFGIWLMSRTGGHGLVTPNLHEYLIPVSAFIVIALYGIYIGAPGQIFYGQAIHAAPNPALATTIINSSTVYLYLVAWMAYKLLPAFFRPASVNWTGLAATVISLIAAAVAIMSRPPQI